MASKNLKAGTIGIKEGHEANSMDVAEILTKFWKNLKSENTARWWMR